MTDLNEEVAAGWREGLEAELSAERERADRLVAKNAVLLLWLRPTMPDADYDADEEAIALIARAEEAERQLVGTRFAITAYERDRQSLERRVATLKGWALKLCGVVFAPEPCETHCARDRAAYLLAEAPDEVRAALSVEPEEPK